MSPRATLSTNVVKLLAQILRRGGGERRVVAVEGHVL